MHGGWTRRNTGEGAYQFGARWNSRGVRAVYCSLDPATAILEVAVHKGFGTPDTEPHVLTAVMITDARGVHLVDPTSVPNANWLRPGSPSAGQQAFGDFLLTEHLFIVIPSTVSTRSWNMIFCCRGSNGCLHDAAARSLRARPPAPSADSRPAASSVRRCRPIAGRIQACRLAAARSARYGAGWHDHSCRSGSAA